MSTFDQRGQTVQVQNNAGGNIAINGNLIANAPQNAREFISEVQKIKGQLAFPTDTEVIDADVVSDVDFELASIVQEVKQPQPNQDVVVRKMERAKQLLEGVGGAATLVTAITKLIEAAKTLF